MTAHHEKVRLVVECSVDERTYIKMLATKSHMTISEFVLSYVRPDLPSAKSRKKPNKDTLEAMQELEEDGGITYKSMDDFWKDMGVKPSARR